MSLETVQPEPRGFRAPGTAFLVVGAVLGAILAYAFQRAGGMAIGPEAFAPISVLWTLLFILATVLLVPVEQYVTREVASGRRALPHDLKPMWTMAGIAAALGGGFVAFTLDDLFESDWQYVAHIILLMVGYALLFFGKGVLAGTRHFAKVGWVLIVENGARLAIGLIVIRLFADAPSLGWAMVGGGFASLALRWWRHDRGDPERPAAPARRFLTGYVGGTATSQILLAGAPLAVAALGGSPALISIVFITFTLYRAPMTFIFAVQGRILPYLVKLHQDGHDRKLGRIALGVVGGGAALAALGGLVGWLVGAEVVELLFGSEFAPSRVVAALAAGGVVAASAAQIASQTLVAEARTSRLTIAWSGGLLVGLLILALVSGEPDMRVALAFASGEVTALSLMGVLAINR